LPRAVPPTLLRATRMVISPPQMTDLVHHPLRDSAEQTRLIARDARAERNRLLSLVVPALALIGFLLLIPLGWLTWQSLVNEGGLTPEHYLRLVEDETYFKSFVLTFEISGLVTLLAILLGYPVSYLLCQLPPRWAAFGLALVIVPFWTSLLVRTYAWMVLLQRRGLVNTWLMDLGVIERPIPFVHNVTGTTIGMLHIMLPFMVLPLYAAMRGIDKEFMRAAANLGATPRYAFWRVFFPLSQPGLFAGTVLVFVICLGFYVTPELLGGGRVIMVSMLVQRNVELYYQWGAASSVAVVLLVFVFIAFAALNRVLAVERVFGAR
jgi:putative spermidine/putrescine transport system permease protein